MKKNTTKIAPDKDAVTAAMEAAKSKLAADQAADASQDSAVPVANVEPTSRIPSLIVWPTDVWGLTKDLKETMIRLASRVNGHADKMELVQKTLAIAVEHLNARYENDVKSREV